MSLAVMRHALAAGFCKRGVRAWCDANGIDMAEVIGPAAPGVDLGRLRAIGDRYALAVVAVVESEDARDG